MTCMNHYDNSTIVHALLEVLPYQAILETTR